MTVQPCMEWIPIKKNLVFSQKLFVKCPYFNLQSAFHALPIKCVIGIRLYMAPNGSVLPPYHLSAFSSWSSQNWWSLATKTLSICPRLASTTCHKSLAFFKPNKATSFRPATVFLKSYVSCVRRLSRNNKKQFKSFTDCSDYFLLISQKTRNQTRRMIASRHQRQNGKKTFRLLWYFFSQHEIWLLSLLFLLWPC